MALGAVLTDNLLGQSGPTTELLRPAEEKGQLQRGHGGAVASRSRGAVGGFGGQRVKSSRVPGSSYGEPLVAAGAVCATPVSASQRQGGVEAFVFQRPVPPRGKHRRAVSGGSLEASAAAAAAASRADSPALGAWDELLLDDDLIDRLVDDAASDGATPDGTTPPCDSQAERSLMGD